jgi:hypothetical protein
MTGASQCCLRQVTVTSVSSLTFNI